MKQVSFVVIGAGARGTAYSSYAKSYPDKMKVVGVAEPRDFYRTNLATEHAIPPSQVFTDWRDLATREQMADVALIATQDIMHVEPAIALARKGYHILLEKPMATNPADCRRIVREVTENNRMFGVCHVLRYTRFTQRLKQLINEGLIGDVVSIQRLEPVGFWHQAHSFVRGNWRKEAESTFMLLAKSCHDLDWIHYIMGSRCTRISSFGTLRHFRKDQKPLGAASRCLDCSIESTCPYSAKRIYHGRVMKGDTAWPVGVITTERTSDGVLAALREGPYGRCVYECDNDVVDNQVVTMEFDGGGTASFTMIAFTRARGRETHVFGTRGELYGDDRTIRHYDFVTGTQTDIDTKNEESSILDGHGGGDYWLIKHFVDAVAENNPSKILSGPLETLESHQMVFAAEQARRKGRIVNMSEFLHADAFNANEC